MHQNVVTGNLADGGIGVADDGPTLDPGAPKPDSAPHTAKNDTVSTNKVTGIYGGCGIVYAAYNKGATAGISGGIISPSVAVTRTA